MIKLAFFEDQPLVLEKLTAIFSDSSKYTIVFAEKNKKDLFNTLDKVEQLPDIILVDLLSEDVVGTEIYEFIVENYPQIEVIALTSISSPVLVESLLSMGVKGYVNKNQEVEDIVLAVHEVANGNFYLPEDYAFLLNKENLNNSNFTKREIEIISYITKEYTTADIASILHISAGTIENHRKTIFKKLNVKNVAGMVREAIKLGLVDL
jgi:DNA-binding NarL/FixJ family response regulator